MMRPILSTLVATATFVCFNMADARLTNQLLAHEGIECFLVVCTLQQQYVYQGVPIPYW
jgi:hypothetical protein